MNHIVALSVLSLALAWSVPSQAQVSPAPEHQKAGAHDGRSAADTGVTGNDGSAANSGGEDNRSDRVTAQNPDHAKPHPGQVGDKTDFTGNEGTDLESTGSAGSGHGEGSKDGDSAKQSTGSGHAGSSGG